MEAESGQGRAGSRWVNRLVDVAKRLTPDSTHPALRYYRFRARAFRISLADRFSHVGGDLPLPPPRLRYRVHGGLDAQTYIDVGKHCADDLAGAAELVGREISSFDHILDFGCGSARVLRHFRDLPASSDVRGTDIDPEAIRWCRKAIPFATFEVNDARPPLPFPDATFDLIYAVSVFTHLDEELQAAWLEDLRRVAAPGAVLLLTTHGTYAQADLPEEYKRRLADHGFAFHKVATGRFKLDGLPDFYQNAYHSKAYVKRHWSRYFDVRHHLERGLNDHQDLVVLEKP